MVQGPIDKLTALWRSITLNQSSSPFPKVQALLFIVDPPRSSDGHRLLILNIHWWLRHSRSFPRHFEPTEISIPYYDAYPIVASS